jgi:type I restriction enzyme M protein
MRADGWSLDDKRAPLLADELLGVNPARALSEAEHAKNNLPDVLARWRLKDGAERQRARTDQSFCVPQAEIAGNGFDLSINRYKEVVHDACRIGRRRRFLPGWQRWRRRFRRG